MIPLRAAAILLLVLVAAQLLAERHVLCAAEDGLFHYAKNCAEHPGLSVPIASSKQDRKFLWFSRDQRGVTIGILPAGATHADRSHTAGMFALHSAINGPADADGTVTLTDEKLGTWTFTLDPWWFRDGRLNIQVPKGTWDLTVTAAGKNLQRPVRVPFLNGPRPRNIAKRPPGPDVPKRKGRVAIRGRALAKGGSPAAFAEVTSDCNRVVCEADQDGRFQCEIDMPPEKSICVEQPRFGRARIELQPNIALIDFGPVHLITGATIRIVKPIHVELPQRTTVSLLGKGKEIAEPQQIDERGVIEFTGLDGGPYHVLLAGPEPLQRKLFPIEVDDRAPHELLLAVDAFRLTGDVDYRDQPLGGATLELNGDAWRAELQTDQSGRFNAELWSPGDYAVLVRSSVLAQPYGQMKRASQSDSHWRFEVPSRRITGRVIDADSGKPVAGASLLVESTSGETRWSRPVVVDENGAFDISGVGEGNYEVAAHAPSYLAGQPLSVSISKRDGDRQIDIPLERGIEIPITVISASGEPVADAIVATDFTPDGLRIQRLLRTDATGRVFVPVAQKTTKAVFIVPKSGSLAMTLIASDDPNGARVVVPDPGVTLTLRARDNDGAGVPNVRYVLWWQGQHLPRALLQQLASVRPYPLATDSSGDVSIPLLPAGRYDIEWIPPAGTTLASRRTTVEAVGGQAIATAQFARR